MTHGGHLVQIKDASEEGFIQWFLNKHDPRHAIWIGLYDIGHEETFKWTSGKQFCREIVEVVSLKS